MCLCPKLDLKSTIAEVNLKGDRRRVYCIDILIIHQTHLLVKKDGQ